MKAKDIEAKIEKFKAKVNTNKKVVDQFTEFMSAFTNIHDMCKNYLKENPKGHDHMIVWYKYHRLCDKYLMFYHNWKMKRIIEENNDYTEKLWKTDEYFSDFVKLA